MDLQVESLKSADHGEKGFLGEGISDPENRDNETHLGLYFICDSH
jgi:hypothetical protein